MHAKISVFVICVEVIIYLLLYNLHDCTFNDTKNTSILNTTIEYILSTKRFDVPPTNF